MKSQEIRERFRDFFVARGHVSVPSDSLIPKSDPTLLFTNAGMNQFKAYFLGQIKDDSMTRATTHQKCLRSSDIENVGHTAQHHTFFEMLGNFSFGDYFKKSAIPWAWELVTDGLGLDPKDLWVTVYTNDDEAVKIWSREVGVAEDRIVRLGEKENFWKMGDTGPCGPCSEIHIDLGVDRGCGRPLPECGPACDCDRFSELWNLVFMQFDRQKDGSLIPLPRPSIDTGMGLERICRILQKVRTNYETDVLLPIVRHVESISGKGYGDSPRDDVSIRIITDHARASLFAIADGVTPSNVGRGYVLRRIIRRALKSARLLGIENIFLAEVFETVARIMEASYPESRDQLPYAQKLVTAEEKRFGSTLDRGMSRLVDLLETAREKGRPITGEEAFNLYDTYGFPLDLTVESAKDEGILVDKEGFEREMEKQREKARQQKKFVVDMKEAFRQAVDLPATRFMGYESEETGGRVLGIIKDGADRKSADQETGEVELVLDQTPFYAESGGQAGDVGIIRALEADGSDVQMVFRVADTQKTANGVILHKGRVEHGTLKTHLRVQAQVDRDSRFRTRRNHTATHLLQAALREVLGDHIRQSGSQVTPTGLRFDFAHFEAATQEQLETVERMVAEYIYQDHPVGTEVKSLTEAVAEGALAFFEEKYGGTVRVVKISDISMELCGGTHCSRTADIGCMKILSESSIAAGVRRIEAVTGFDAYSYLAEREKILRLVSQILKTSPDETVERIEKILESNRNLANELEELSRGRLALRGEELWKKAGKIGDVPVLVSSLGELSPKDLVGIMDDVRSRMQSGVALLASCFEGKITFICQVTPDLTKKVHAGNVVREAAKITGGSGGGKPERAQAGGREPAKLDEALSTAEKMIKEALG